MTGFADEFYENHVESMLDEDFPKPLHSLSPQELADQGIPVEVALRARLLHEEAISIAAEQVGREGQALYRGGHADAYRDALAIIEAKS